MADPVIQAFQASPEILSGAAIPFRFEVTWRSLTGPLRPTPMGTTATAATQTLPARRAPDTRAEAREWEMVLPRMTRPAAVASQEQVALLAAPEFSTASSGAVARRLGPLAGAALVMAVVIGGYAWLRPAVPDPSTVAGMEMGGAGWITEWASDPAGSARGRQISLYRPSISMSDYRLEFLGRIGQRSLGWVFRAADSSNYYAAKLVADRPGSALTITRFAVIHGMEGLHIERTLALAPRAGELLKVRLDARGPRFTVYVQNQVVEDWEDDRLKSGGLGFLNEREERGQVGSIQISFTKGGMRR